ncbi:MAG: rod shape-determining protein [Salibacteraceae bacterium]
MKTYRFGAIDIGSNAVRLLISNVFESGAKATFKKQSLVRVPIRLGADAFLNHTIPADKQEDFINTMHAFQHLIAVYRPHKFRAIATSAFREADNGIALVNRTFEETGIRIEVISGKEEAEIVYANGLRDNMDENKTYLYMDVGGGSTELTLFHKHKAVASGSFNVGSVRLLMNIVRDDDWDDMKKWVRSVTGKISGELALIGSGGNINKYCKLLMKEYGEAISPNEIHHLYKRLKSMTTEQRIEQLYLNPDRADVIVPAGKIFTSILKWSGASTAYVPKIGVSDGIVKLLYNQMKIENAFA